jgi:hypothetical protein
MVKIGAGRVEGRVWPPFLFFWTLALLLLFFDAHHRRSWGVWVVLFRFVFLDHERTTSAPLACYKELAEFLGLGRVWRWAAGLPRDRSGQEFGGPRPRPGGGLESPLPWHASSITRIQCSRTIP